MGRNNRQRRKEKQALSKKKKLLKKTKKQVSQSNVSLHVLENPFANISHADIKSVIEEVQKNSIEDYENSLTQLQNIFKTYNPIVLLSFISDYGLTVGVSDKGIESYDKNVNQAHVEICQALILQIKQEELNNKTPSPEILQNLIDLLEKLLLSNQFKNRDSKTMDLPEKEANIEKSRAYVISHTQLVRNWGSFKQVKNIASELYGKFDESLLKEYAFNSFHVIHFFNHLLKKTEDNATNKFKIFREIKQLSNIEDMVYKYHNFINVSKLESDEFIQYLKDKKATNQQEILLLLNHHYIDCHLQNHFTFNYKNIAHELGFDVKIVEAISNEFSLIFGELKDFNTEYIYLDNKVWTKPIIFLGEKEFFCPMPQLFFSFILTSFDNLINKIDKERLSKIKSDYLEDKIEEIVKTKFQKLNTIKSLEWKDNDRTYETDLITFIDCYAIIFEAKSGKIDSSSLRGSADRLKKDIKELLVKPNIQSKRLKEKLEYLIYNPHIKDDIRDKLPMSLNKIHKVLRVSVTLEYFASLQSNITSLEKTGWIPNDYIPCPTMNIADFETLFDIFDHPIQIINYLEMREEIEGKVKYQGDELDLISLYMDNHLNFANINPDMSIMVAGMSEKIDNYYQSKEIGIKIDKPKPIMNKFFEKILVQLENRQPHGWTQIGSIIYRLLPDDQLKIINLITEIRNNVKKNWMKKGHKNILIYNPPLSSEYALCYIVFNNQNKEKRDDFFDEAIFMALEPEHVKYCLAIAKNIDINEMPYAMIAVSNKEDNKILEYKEEKK